MMERRERRERWEKGLCNIGDKELREGEGRRKGGGGGGGQVAW